MTIGSRVVLALALLSIGAAIQVVAWPRPGRLFLVRVPTPCPRIERRVMLLNALAMVAGGAVILLARDPSGWTQALGGLAAGLVAPVVMLAALLQTKRSHPVARDASRFVVPLAAAPGLSAYLSWPLLVATVIALVLPAVLLHELHIFFLPLMLFLAGLVTLTMLMQARERWALPPGNEARARELGLEKRRRAIRLLQLALLAWSVAAGLIWASVVLGHAGPGYLGAGIAVAIGGPGLVLAAAFELPRLGRLADELARLAGAEAPGTRAHGWRWGGLVYFAPADPGVFVPKRSGMGQTLNLARPQAWLLMAAVLVVPPAITLLALTAR